MKIFISDLIGFALIGTVFGIIFGTLAAGAFVAYSALLSTVCGG